MPALWPCRTIHNREGHLCRTAETKRQKRESSEQPLGLEPGAKRLCAGEEMGLHPDRLGAVDVDLAVVDEQRFARAKTEAVEGEEVDRRIGLQELHLAGNDDIAEAAEEGLLLGVEGRPDIGREIGDGEEGDCAPVQFLDDRVDPGDGIADRLAEALAPRLDEVGIFRKLGAELVGRFTKVAAAVERVVPFPKADILDELEPLPVFGDLADEEAFGIPAVKDVADIEDDGGRCRADGQPWRALKRRFVLLMT